MLAVSLASSPPDDTPEAENAVEASPVEKRLVDSLRRAGYFAVGLSLVAAIWSTIYAFVDDRAAGSCPTWVSSPTSSPSSSISPSAVSSSSSSYPSSSSPWSSPDVDDDSVRTLLSFSRGGAGGAATDSAHSTTQAPSDLNGDYLHDFYSIWLSPSIKPDHVEAPGPLTCLRYKPGGLLLRWLGRNPLFAATACNWPEMVREWIDDRIETCTAAGLGLGDQLGPVMLWAAMTNHPDMVADALKVGTNVDYVSSDRGPAPGFTALQVAADMGHHRVVELLLDAGAATDLEVPSAALQRGGRTPLMMAAAGNHTMAFDLLLTKSLKSINHQDDHGRTALIMAADGGFVQILSGLLQHGAALDLQNNVGVTALIAATTPGPCREGTQMLLAAGANASIAGKNRRTALFWAASNGWLKEVKQMLELHVDPREEDITGIVPGDLVPKGDSEELKSLRALLPVPSYSQRWANLLEDRRRQLAITLLVPVMAGLCVLCWKCIGHILCTPGESSSPDEAPERERMPKVGAMILASKQQTSVGARFWAWVIRFVQAFYRAVAPMITMWVLQPTWVLIPGGLYMLLHVSDVYKWSPAALATQHHRSLLRARNGFSVGRPLQFAGLFGYFLILLTFSSSTSVSLENLIYLSLPLGQQQVLYKTVMILDSVLLVLLLALALQAAAPKLLGGIFPQLMVKTGDNEAQLAPLRDFWNLSHQISGTDNRTQLEDLKLTPLGSWDVLSLSLTAVLLFVDIASDLFTIHTFLLHRHFYFAGVLLCTFTTSLVMEGFEQTIFQLPWAVKESYDQGFVCDRLQKLLDHEAGYEAVISLGISVYGLPFAAVTDYEKAMGLFSCAMSLYGLANFLHSKFDLRINEEEIGLLFPEGGSGCPLVCSTFSPTKRACHSRSSSWSSSTSWSSTAASHSEDEEQTPCLV